MRKKIGIFLILWYIGLLIHRFNTGYEHNLLFASHAALLLGGVAYLRDSKLLWTGTLVLILIPHLFWITDFFLFITGLPNMQIASYLQYVSPWTWFFTSHHLFLTPLLAYTLYRQGVHPHGWIVASAYFALLTFLTLTLTEAGPNVNCAFRVCEIPMLDFLRFLDRLPQVLYWLVENTLLTLLVYLPVNLGLGKIEKLIKG